jgi:DNA-binding transcriptional LysR family regulator
VTPLVRLPLVLLIPKKSKWKSADEFWRANKRSDALIGLPPDEAVSELFQAELKRRKIAWPWTTEASSLELITQYVANGEGVGVSIAMPEIIKHRNVRVLPLDDFPAVELGVLWLGEPSPLLRLTLQEISTYVRETWPEQAV